MMAMGCLGRMLSAPFVLVGSLLKLLFLPALVLVFVVLLAPEGWGLVVGVGLGGYLAGVITAFRAGARGMTRSLERSGIRFTGDERSTGGRR
ncbi:MULTISPECIES: hypothetical protein [Actinosynnema]|uniref:hypothetical protein n=1 Tax=Actinosynnema TaxID=40566 RepID=UPI0020A2F1F1|nr:hypothetical protein [Actinosynnema pretiosum]